LREQDGESKLGAGWCCGRGELQPRVSEHERKQKVAEGRLNSWCSIKAERWAVGRLWREGSVTFAHFVRKAVCRGLQEDR